MGKVYALAGIFILGCLLGFAGAWKVQAGRLEKAQAKTAKVATAAELAKAKAELSEKTQEILYAHAEADAARKEVYRVLSRKVTGLPVPVRPTQPAAVPGEPCPDPDCSLPNSGLCILDSGAIAAQGGPPQPACGPDDAASGITYPVLVGWQLQILADKAHNDAQLVALQDWVKAQHAAYSK